MSKYNLTDILEQYKIGSGWTTDFDYDGMLKAGLKTGVDTDIEVLKKMAEDYTDVNYHREASHLYNAIEELEATAKLALILKDAKPIELNENQVRSVINKFNIDWD